jgi:hypothetical protein
VQVAVGQQEIMKLRKRLRKGLIVMIMKKKKRCLMWKKSTLLTMLTWDPLCSWLLQTLYGGCRLATRARLNLRENRRILTRTKPRDAYDYRFHSLFQQDF